MEATGDGLVLRRVPGSARLTTDAEGIVIVDLDGVERVSNDEVLDAINADRASR